MEEMPAEPGRTPTGHFARPANRKPRPGHPRTTKSARPSGPRPASGGGPRKPTTGLPSELSAGPGPTPPVVGADLALGQAMLDDKLLAHLDTVLADLGGPVLAVAAPEVTTTAPVSAAPAPLWAHLVADPGFAAEHLADAAAGQLGPWAHAWVQRMRTRYPHARPDALARLAVTEHVRLARRQAFASGTALGAVVELGLLARTHARLVLTVAAVYGADPGAPDRSDDLLALLPVPRLTQPVPAAAGDARRLFAAWAVRRVAARVMPFGAMVASLIHSGLTTETLGRRAIARFRPR